MIDLQENSKLNWMTNKKTIVKEEDQEKITNLQKRMRDRIMFELVKDVAAFKL